MKVSLTISRDLLLDARPRLTALIARLVVNDLRMAQTSTQNLAKQVLALIRTKNYGTYHASDHGDYSWYEFAKRIFHYSGMNVVVTPVSWRVVPSVAPRPKYSVLENRGLKKLGLDQMQPIDAALQAYLKARQGILLSQSSQSVGVSAPTA